MINRRGFFAIAAAGATSALAACSTGSSSDKASSATSGSAGSAGSGAGFPVTIKHALGTAKLEKAPTKVVTAGWSDADILLALGVVPVAAPAITWGGNAAKSSDWFDAKLKEVGGKAPERYSDADGTPVDKVAQYQPDFISGTNSGLKQAEYDKLTKIAPTLAYPTYPYGTSWQESTKMIAEALGKKDEGEKVIFDTQAKVRAALDKHPELKGKSVAWVYFDAAKLNSITVYTLNDNRPRGLADFGLKTPSFVTKASQGAKTFSTELSAEKASELDADIVVFDAVDAATTKKITSDKLLSQIPAFTKGSYLALTDQKASETMASPTPLSIPVAIDTFLPKLAEAAKKA